VQTRTITLPATFGKYRLIRLLGKGGMAYVYLAEIVGDHGFSKEVALKLIDGEAAGSEAKIEALVNEANVGGRLRHPNLVDTYDTGEIDGRRFIAMEYIEGWTLEDLILKHTQPDNLLPTTVIAEILLAMCKGLGHAHERCGDDGELLNLVHRDLKPANVMITKDGVVKILDFGIAKSTENPYQTMVAGTTKGTPQYMSPEQVTGESMDGRSDIFALGIVLYQMLTRELLFEGETLYDVMTAVLSDNKEDELAAIDADFPMLAGILRKCLKKERDDRYASVEEMLDEISLAQALSSGLSLEAWLRRLVRKSDTPTADEVPALKVTPEPVCDPDSLTSVHADSVAPLTAEEMIYHDEEDCEEWDVSAPKVWTAANKQSDVGSTRMQKTIPKKPVSRLTWAIVAVCVAFLMLGVWMVVPSGDDGVAEAVAEAAPDKVPEPTVVLESQPEPGDLEVLSIALPEPAPTPKQVLRTARKPDPTPAPVEKQDGYGTVTIGSKPWSTVFIDGKDYGRTPVIGQEVAEGTHTARLVCGSCPTPKEQVIEFTIGRGEDYKHVATRF